MPSVSAPLSDPRATISKGSLPVVDVLLRHVVHALLCGTDVAVDQLSEGLDPQATAATLGYLRDRVSVPRDMSSPAALELRAHLNWLIQTAGECGQ